MRPRDVFYALPAEQAKIARGRKRRRVAFVVFLVFEIALGAAFGALVAFSLF